MRLWPRFGPKREGYSPLLRTKLTGRKPNLSSPAIDVRFEVLDDGPGLPETNGVVALETLASRQGQAGDSAGLGLVVTRRVAEAHRGRVGAHNRESGGASVWFDIPVERRDG